MFVNERSIDIDEESLSEDATCEQMIEHYFKQGFVAFSFCQNIMA